MQSRHCLTQPEREREGGWGGDRDGDLPFPTPSPSNVFNAGNCHCVRIYPIRKSSTCLRYTKMFCGFLWKTSFTNDNATEMKRSFLAFIFDNPFRKKAANCNSIAMPEKPPWISFPSNTNSSAILKRKSLPLPFLAVYKNLFLPLQSLSLPLLRIKTKR